MSRLVPRFTTYKLPSFGDSWPALRTAFIQLIKQMNEEARDVTQRTNQFIAGELFAMPVTLETLPFDIPTTVVTPRGVIVVQCNNTDDPNDYPGNPGVNWTYAPQASTITVRALDGLTAATNYNVTFAILDAKARGDSLPLSQPQVI